MAKILIVEDDLPVAGSIAHSLEMSSHTVEVVSDGHEAADRLRLYSYDLVILDWAIPGLVGVEVCRQYRLRGGAVPILILTGKTEVADKVEGLDAGADDYLTKPFSLKELRARVDALLRRQSTVVPDILTVAGLSLNRKTGTVLKDGTEIALLPKELAVFDFLLRHPNQLFTVQDLLNRLWSSESDASEDAVRQSIARLRKKIDSVDRASVITTVKGLGYKIEVR